jgi:hypothetical protein
MAHHAPQSGHGPSHGHGPSRLQMSGLVIAAVFADALLMLPLVWLNVYDFSSAYNANGQTSISWGSLLMVIACALIGILIFRRHGYGKLWAFVPWATVFYMVEWILIHHNLVHPNGA